jgi:hypothetical protein
MGAAMAAISSLRAKEWFAVALAGVLIGHLAAHAVGPVGAAGDRVDAWRPTAERAMQVVNRTPKGDRLNVVFSPVPDAHASGRIALRDLLQRALSRDLRDTCEPPASPYVDPQLAKLPGRCLT